jgi:predicted RNase H-like nuclease (RuvC/YqgF family)
VKKASPTSMTKILPLTQQLTNETNNYQVQQLQEEIKRLQKQIQDLKAERERERERESKEPDSVGSNYHISDETIENYQKELAKKQSQLEDLQKSEKSAPET